MGAIVASKGGDLYEVVQRRPKLKGEGFEVLIEDLSTPTASEREQSRLENRGRCTAEPSREWQPVERLIGMALVRAPVSLARFTA